MRERLAQEIVGVAGLRDDVAARLREQPRDALAHQHVVLPDHDPQGGHPASLVLAAPWHTSRGMTDGIQYLLPAGTRPAAAVELLAARLGVVVDGAAATERTFYDTFDGRLHAAGLVLLHEDGRLKLADAVGYGERAGAPCERPPARLLVADLAPGPLRDALAPIVEMRALLPTARCAAARAACGCSTTREDGRAAALETAALATDGARAPAAAASARGRRARL